MIMNLLKQNEALQNNMKQNDLKQNNSNKVTLHQVTVQGKRKQFNTSKCCWSHGSCAHSSENCRNKKMAIKIQQLLQIKWEEV